MTLGDTDVRIVEDPTAATVDSALAASLAATSLSGTWTLVNLGQNILVASHAPH